MKTLNQFTQLPFSIMASTKLTSTQKIIISYVLGWQNENKVCFESNSTLASRFGMKLYDIKYQIKLLNKLPFFTSKETSRYNESGAWQNSKQMTINEQLLETFLSTPEQIAIPTVENEPEPIVAPIPEEKPKAKETSTRLIGSGTDALISPVQCSKKYKPEPLEKEDLIRAYPIIANHRMDVILTVLQGRYNTTAMYPDDERLISIMNNDEMEMLDECLAINKKNSCKVFSE
jgi:hypothetical protein